MKELQIVSLLAVLLLRGTPPVAAQDCERLKNAAPDELVSYLNGLAPDEGNAQCVTFAIKVLDRLRYEPAIPVLSRLLDFRRPPNHHEQHGILLHPPIIEEIYPTANALEEIGQSALPSVLEVIKSGSASSRARENAASVWMVIHKYESPKGVALLRQEAANAGDDVARKNLEWAISKAVAWCNPADQELCKTAAKPAN